MTDFPDMKFRVVRYSRYAGKVSKVFGVTNRLKDAHDLMYETGYSIQWAPDGKTWEPLPSQLYVFRNKEKAA